MPILRVKIGCLGILRSPSFCPTLLYVHSVAPPPRMPSDLVMQTGDVFPMRSCLQNTQVLVPRFASHPIATVCASLEPNPSLFGLRPAPIVPPSKNKYQERSFHVAEVCGLHFVVAHLFLGQSDSLFKVLIFNRAIAGFHSKVRAAYRSSC